MSGIYIHIPFCKQACHYCNFHFSTSLKYKAELVNAIVREIEMTTGYLSSAPLSGIYFGGGTPSLLNIEELTYIFQILRKKYKWAGNAEITLEANPDDIDLSKLKHWKALGINRLSIGIQSFFNEDLHWMNRAHSADEAEASIKLAQDAGLINITVDLIYGSPTTSDAMWAQNIDKALGYNIDHISSYCLTVEKGTALAHFVAKGKYPDIDQQKAANQFDMLIDTLCTNGYEHYEISNFARNKRYSVHNSSYWKGDPYLGVGPGAHSYNGLSRRWNVSNNMKYIKAIEKGILPFEEEVLSSIDRYNEYVITRLRTKWGIDHHAVPEGLSDHFSEKIAWAKNEGYVYESENTIILTRKGKHFADMVSMELMYEKR